MFGMNVKEIDATELAKWFNAATSHGIPCNRRAPDGRNRTGNRAESRSVTPAALCQPRFTNSLAKRSW